MRILIGLLFSIVISSTVYANDCPEPVAATPAVFKIERTFEPGESYSIAVNKIQATAWLWHDQFTLVTSSAAIAGVFKDHDWKEFKITSCAMSETNVMLRLKALTSPQVGERMAVLESMFAIEAITPLTAREYPMGMETPVTAIAYPDGVLQVVPGMYKGLGDDEDANGLGGRNLGEFFVDNNRLILDDGSTGGVILDNEGTVAFVIHSIITQGTMTFLDNTIIIPTSWGNPTHSLLDILWLDQVLTLPKSDEIQIIGNPYELPVPGKSSIKTPSPNDLFGPRVPD